jgi:hypothetical protein
MGPMKTVGMMRRLWMIRRLLETLIIEVFEQHKLAAKIQNPAGDFLYLRDLITATLAEPT